MSEGDGTVWRFATWAWDARADASDLWRIVHGDRAIDAVAVIRAGVDVGDSLESLASVLGEPLAASVSPILVTKGSLDRVAPYELNAALPPPPTLSMPSPACAVFAVDALRIAWPERPTVPITWPDVLPAIATRLVDRGWRHVGAPGLGMSWSADRATVDPRGGWSDSTAAEIDGDANESLATHRLWADTRAGVDVVVDGPCLDGDPHNGSQALVLNVARSLARGRPSARVRVAVEHRNRAAVEAALGGAIDVIDRGDAVDADVVYRPYQLLVPSELRWLTESGRRLLVGQLDMIGFSNPSYHPSPALFHAVRNLQRLTMRVADGVTFISEFGRRSATVECPDLDPARTFVVYSGASTPEPTPQARVAVSTPYVLCLSAPFWHKNREHAIRTFAAMVGEHGYRGDLMIAGPEPFYGRSTGEEAALLSALPTDVRARVRYLGRVDDSAKWDLLAAADLVIYPSVVEGFGMVPFEAAAVGTPSIVAPGSALAEIFEGTGAVVPSWDVAIWGARAASLVHDPSAARDAVAAIESCAQRYSWDTVAVATWHAIDEVLARPRARLHREEGGIRSRVAARWDSSPAAPSVHFVNRVGAYVRRKLPSPLRRS